MAGITVAVRTGKVPSMLKRLARACSGADPATAGCLETLGVAALNDQRKGFIERSQPTNASWPPVHVATAILRKGGGKAFTEADLEAKRLATPKLRDSGLLLDTLSRGAQRNVFRLGKLEIAVGTADRRAAVLHRGGKTDPFEFDEEAKKRLAENISMTLQGGGGKAQRVPRRLKSGKRRQWAARGLTSPWNPLYFVWRAVFRRWAKLGRRGTVPARPIIVTPTTDQRGTYARIIAHFLGKAAKG